MKYHSMGEFGSYDLRRLWKTPYEGPDLFSFRIYKAGIIRLFPDKFQGQLRIIFSVCFFTVQMGKKIKQC